MDWHHTIYVSLDGIRPRRVVPPKICGLMFANMIMSYDYSAAPDPVCQFARLRPILADLLPVTEQCLQFDTDKSTGFLHPTRTFRI
jgi:hypothetical protein